LPYPAARALKKVLPWNLVNPQGSLLFGVPPAVTPGLMSLTSFVPTAVPSDFQGSSPCMPSLAGKMRARLVLTKERQFDELPSGPALMFFTSSVPDAVPSDLQSS